MEPFHPDEEPVDLDLKAVDAQLREAVGKPTTVRIDGMVIHISHAAEWPSSAMQAAARGHWNEWAVGVIHDPAECQAFTDADLPNYQLEAVFDACARKGNISARKSRRSPR